MSQLRVMRFMNQFFADIGREEKANTPVGSFKGQVGLGRRLQSLLGDRAEIVTTVYCGDNFFNYNPHDALSAIARIIRGYFGRKRLCLKSGSW